MDPSFLVADLIKKVHTDPLMIQRPVIQINQALAAQRLREAAILKLSMLNQIRSTQQIQALQEKTQKALSPQLSELLINNISQVNEAADKVNEVLKMSPMVVEPAHIAQPKEDEPVIKKKEPKKKETNKAKEALDCKIRLPAQNYDEPVAVRRSSRKVLKVEVKETVIPREVEEENFTTFMKILTDLIGYETKLDDKVRAMLKKNKFKIPAAALTVKKNLAFYKKFFNGDEKNEEKNSVTQETQTLTTQETQTDIDAEGFTICVEVEAERSCTEKTEIDEEKCL